MKMKFFRLIIMGVTLFVIPGYSTMQPFPTAISEIKNDLPEIIYYEADLAPFPPKVREWIMNKAFTKEKMEKPSMINSKLKVWWSDDNNSVLAEASYIIAKGYKGAGTLKTWGPSRYSGSPAIFNQYGKYAKYHTLKFKWEVQQEAAQLVQNDPMYAEIIAFSKQLCDEIEYDWTNFSGYRGSVKRTPNKKYFVCEGYANEVMDKIVELSCVQSVQKWSSSGHAWNIVKLIDGRTLYLDLTWFDNEHIDEKTGKIYQTDDYDWANITFDEDLFLHSNVGYGSQRFEHKEGKQVNELIKGNLIPEEDSE